MHHGLTAFLLLCACLCWPPGLGAFESYRLDNGLEIFLQADHSVPLVDIRITFRAGAIVETAGLNGLCHQVSRAVPHSSFPFLVVPGIQF